MAFAGIFTTGCGNACDDAADHVAECLGVEGEGEAEGEEAECSGAVECQAGCINDASCDDIKAPAADSAYTTCLADCGTGG